MKCFKTYYRKQLVKNYIVCAEHNEAQTVNVWQALHMVKTVWDSVSQATISNCFNHVKIFPTTNDTNATTTNDEDDLPLNELQKLVRQLTYSEMTADGYIKIENMEEIGQTLDDINILKLVAVDNPDVLVNSDDEDGTSDDGFQIR